MKFIRRADAEHPLALTGGVYLHPTDGGTLAIQYRRPRPGDTDEIAADLVALGTALRRFQLHLNRYLSDGSAGAQPPRLEVGKSVTRPIVEWAAQHVLAIDGLVDGITGDPIAWDDLAEGDRHDLLLSLGMDALVTLIKDIKESNGLPGDLAARLRSYLEIQWLKGGCSCPTCSGEKVESPDCLLTELRPIDDVRWALAEYHRARDQGRLAAAPGWLREVADIITAKRAEQRVREDDSKRQAALAAKYFGGSA